MSLRHSWVNISYDMENDMRGAEGIFKKVVAGETLEDSYSALLLAFGLGGKIAMIDTENGSDDLYCHLGDYDICSLSAPYDPRKYIQTIHEAEQAGYDILIIDSLSHAWSGEGGVLDLQSRAVASNKSGNSYAAWRQVTPIQNRLVDCILASPCHIIATMRSKTEYIQAENERGRMDYEFGTVFDISLNHMATVSKDRTEIFDNTPFAVSQETGKKLRAWLDDGADIPKNVPEIQREGSVV